MSVCTDILIDQDWRGNGWLSETSGDGAVSNASGILTTTGTTGQAQRSFFVPISPGATVEVESLARLVSGTAGIYLYLVNNTKTGTLAASAVATVDDWKKYNVNYTVPYSQTSDTLFILVRFGVEASGAGDARFQTPVIRVGRGIGMPLCIARGLIQQSGSPSLVTTRANHGIASLAFNGSDTVTVTLQHAVPINGPLPIVQLSGTSGQPTRIPLVGAFTGGTSPTVAIVWTNGTALQNVSASATFVYITVWV